MLRLFGLATFIFVLGTQEQRAFATAETALKARDTMSAAYSKVLSAWNLDPTNTHAQAALNLAYTANNQAAHAYAYANMPDYTHAGDSAYDVADELLLFALTTKKANAIVAAQSARNAMLNAGSVMSIAFNNYDLSDTVVPLARAYQCAVSAYYADTSSTDAKNCLLACANAYASAHVYEDLGSTVYYAEQGFLAVVNKADPPAGQQAKAYLTEAMMICDSVRGNLEYFLQ